MMTELSKTDRAWIELLAKDIAAQVVEKTLAAHITACPHGQRMARAKALMIGVGIGLSVATGGLGFAIGKLAAAF